MQTIVGMVRGLVQYKYNDSKLYLISFRRKCQFGEHISFIRVISKIDTNDHLSALKARDSNIDQQIMSIYCIANKKNSKRIRR